MRSGNSGPRFRSCWRPRAKMPTMTMPPWWPREASGCRSSWKPISSCWRSTAVRKRRHRRRHLQPCGFDPRPFGAAGAGGLGRPRLDQGSGARRTRAQGAGSRQADRRAARPAQQYPRAAAGRARRKGRQGRQRLDREAARRSRSRRAPRSTSASRPMPIWSIPSRRASIRSRRRWPTARPCCRSISDAMRALSGRCRKTARWRSRRSRRRRGEIESKVRKLREALEPQAAMISDIPPFDLKLGYELYSLLLKPVEAAGSNRRA